jgi:hypothetical protein
MALIDKLLCRTSPSPEKPMPTDIKEEKKVLESFIAVRTRFLLAEMEVDQSELHRRTPTRVIHSTVNEEHLSQRYAVKKGPKVVNA